MKLRSENRDVEEKLREALGTAQHRGDVIKQLREELKQSQNKVMILFYPNAQFVKKNGISHYMTCLSISLWSYYYGNLGFITHTGFIEKLLSNKG